MALQQKKPEVVKFMGTQVKPTMAALLGKTEWNRATPNGFGCYGCHTKDEGGAAARPPADRRSARDEARRRRARRACQGRLVERSDDPGARGGDEIAAAARVRVNGRVTGEPV